MRLIPYEFWKIFDCMNWEADKIEESTKNL
jgi:hypothetical protein